jgi:hypothetical protein
MTHCRQRGSTSPMAADPIARPATAGTVELADARTRISSPAEDACGNDRDRGTPRDVTPPTPPGIRVRTTAVRPVERSRPLKIGQPERVEVGAGERPAKRRSKRHPPRSAIAACREDGILGVDATLPQLTEARAGSRPLFPDDGPKPPPNPLVKTSENRGRFAEAEIRPPPE